MNKQFVRFAVAGFIAAGVNFLSRIALNRWMPYTTAILLAYLLGMFTAFLLNRALVFRNSSNRIHQQIIWFCIVNAAAALQTLVISLLLRNIVFPSMNFSWHAETVAHGIGVATPIFSSFIGHKKYTFRQDQDDKTY